MKKIKVLLLLILCLSMCACGSNNATTVNGADKEHVMTWQEQYDLGIRYLSEGNYQEAIIAFTAAIEINPKQATPYVGRGDAYTGVAQLSMSDVEENTELTEDAAEAYKNAVADYLEAIGLDESVAEIYQKAAETYVLLGDIDAAIKILERGVGATESIELQEYLVELNESLDEKRGAELTKSLLTDDMLSYEDWYVGDKIISECTLSDFVAAYPSADQFGSIWTNAYYPSAHWNSGTTGSGNMEVHTHPYIEAKFYYMPDVQMFQPNVRGIQMGESFESAMSKVGFSKAGIDYLQNKIDSEDSFQIEIYNDNIPYELFGRVFSSIDISLSDGDLWRRFEYNNSDDSQIILIFDAIGHMYTKGQLWSISYSE